MPAESAAALRYMKLRLKICNKSRLSAIVLHSKLGALFFNEYALNVTRALAKNVNTNNGFKKHGSTFSVNNCCWAGNVRKRPFRNENGYFIDFTGTGDELIPMRCKALSE